MESLLNLSEVLTLSDEKLSALFNEGKKYFPHLRFQMATTKNDAREQIRAFTYRKNNGSYTLGTFMSMLAGHKIAKVAVWLEGKGYRIIRSKTTYSIYFEYKGHNLRISDHRKRFEGIDLLVRWDTQPEEVTGWLNEIQPAQKAAKLAMAETVATDQIEFEDDIYDCYKTECYGRTDMFIGDERVAYAMYSIIGDECYPADVTAIVKGHGYGKMVMRHLAAKYGYENVVRTSLTPDGAKMRATLDKEFNFDYAAHQDSKNMHLKMEVIDYIKNDLVRNFIKDMCKHGYSHGWAQHMQHPEFRKLGQYLEKNFDIDFNEIAHISEWVKGSVENDNLPEHSPPRETLKTLSVLFKLENNMSFT